MKKLIKIYVFIFIIFLILGTFIFFQTKNLNYEIDNKIYSGSVFEKNPNIMCENVKLGKPYSCSEVEFFMNENFIGVILKNLFFISNLIFILLIANDYRNKK